MKLKSLVLVLTVLFTLMLSVNVFTVNASEYIGEVRWDFIEGTEGASVYKQGSDRATLGHSDGALNINATSVTKGNSVGFVLSDSFTVDSDVHKYLIFKADLPANITKISAYLYSDSGDSVYAYGWENNANALFAGISEGTKTYALNLSDSKKTSGGSTSPVADGQYGKLELRFRCGKTADTTAFPGNVVLSVDYVALSAYNNGAVLTGGDPNSSVIGADVKPTLITGVNVNSMEFGFTVDDAGYTLCKDTAAYLTLDCMTTAIEAKLQNADASVTTNITKLQNHKILDITVTDSDVGTASYRFVFAEYLKSGVEDLRWDFNTNWGTEGWKSNNTLKSPLIVGNGRLNASTKWYNDAYFSIELSDEDIFNSYRYIHFKAKNNSATNTMVQVYLKASDWLHQNVPVQTSESDYSIYTLDLHKFIDNSGKTYIKSNLCTVLRIDFYNVGSSVTTYDGNMDFDWIVLSQEADPESQQEDATTYSVTEAGRYRILGTLTNTGTGSESAVVEIYNNDTMVHKNYFPDGESGIVDVRILASKGDNIKAKLILTGEDVSLINWSQEVTLINTVIPHNESSTTLGENCSIISETTLSSYLGADKPDDVKIYTTLYGIKHYMKRESENNRWYLTEPYVKRENIIASDERGRLEDMVWQNEVADENYVYDNKIYTSKNPVSNATTYIEIPVEADGIIKVDGDFVIPEEGVNDAGETIRLDGELIKFYVNDELIWSNRVGGEVSTRYDEPYDTKYFINSINAVADVKAGDILKFSFNRWRHNYVEEYIDISNIKIKYVEGDVLSDSTVWKLKNSIVADASKCQLYVNGNPETVQMDLRDGNIYIPLETATEIFANSDITSDDGYVPIYETAKLLGVTPVRMTDTLVVIQDCAINMFTYNETSEIITEFTRETIPQTQDAEFYIDGEKVPYLAAVTSKTDIVAKRQVVVGTPESTVSILPIIALYNYDSLVNCYIGEQVNDLNGTMSEIIVTFEDYIYNHGDYIKVFYWESLDTITPILNAQQIN